jgi:hypothetical protein
MYYLPVEPDTLTYLTVRWTYALVAARRDTFTAANGAKARKGKQNAINTSATLHNLVVVTHTYCEGCCCVECGACRLVHVYGRFRRTWRKTPRCTNVLKEPAASTLSG